ARAQGLGTAEDKKAAMAAWSKSCAKGYERACAVTGLNLVLGIDGIKKDAEVGVELLQGACRASVAEACKDLGGLHLGGMVPDADRTEGVQRLTEACDLGYGEGCNELGVAYAQGLGVERADAAMAVRLFDRACRLGADNGCSNFGLALSQGVGVERDLKRAHKLFHAACHRGHQASCEHHQKLADEH
ncbi:MAG: tetratricopeptide repeat protein, partial [Myxococcota bacterium]